MRLIDADELRDIYTGVPNGLYTTGHIVTAIDECKTVDAATVAKDTNVPDKWVSVKDRLPEKSGQYLCWFGANKVVIGPAIETYVDEWKAFGDLVSLEKYPNITHWMPLPEPPKEETC